MEKYKQEHKYLWYGSTKKDFWQILFKQFLKTLPKKKVDPNNLSPSKSRLYKLRVEAKERRSKIFSKYNKS